jgi:hypothetical protein
MKIKKENDRMDIKSALIEAMKRNACISRPKYGRVLKLKAAKNERHIDIFYLYDKKFERWCPTVEDLTSDDWYVTN